MQDDASLVAAYQSGSNAAFEELYARYFRDIYRFVYARTHHRETAEDIVSQTFLKALQGIQSFDSAKGSFAGWIYRIARNLVIDHYRSLRPDQSIEDAWDLQDDTDIPMDAHARLRIQSIRAALQKLKPDQRETVLLRVWHGRTFAEIAEILGSTEAACKMAYKRAVESVRNVLLLSLILSSPLFLP